MNYHHFKPLQDDPLKIVKFLGSDIYQFRISKIILLVIMIVTLFITVTQTFYGIFIFNAKEAVNYASFYFGCYYLLLEVIVLLTRNRLLNELMDPLEKYSLDSCGKKFEETFHLEANLISLVCASNAVLGILGGILHTIPTDSDEELFFAFRLIDEWFPQHNLILKVCYRIMFIPMGLVMLAHGFQTVYVCRMASSQLLLGIEYLSQFTDDYEGVADEILVFDEIYQKEMRKRLGILIKRHVHLAACLSSALAKMKGLIVAFATVGCLLGLSCVFSVFGYQGDFSFFMKIRLFVIGCASSLNFVLIIMSGQQVESLGEKVFIQLSHIKWYNWNLESQKVFLIALINTSVVHSIKFSNKFTINYDLGVGVGN